jgi:hypothetical protein
MSLYVPDTSDLLQVLILNQSRGSSRAETFDLPAFADSNPSSARFNLGPRDLARSGFGISTKFLVMFSGSRLSRLVMGPRHGAWHGAWPLFPSELDRCPRKQEFSRQSAQLMLELSFPAQNHCLGQEPRTRLFLLFQVSQRLFLIIATWPLSAGTISIGRERTDSRNMVPRRHSRSPPATAPSHHTETRRRATHL